MAGPLLGGFFTTQLSWRWIFYINLPLGLVALAIVGATLSAPARVERRRIDYAGALALSFALGALVLVTDLGGLTYPWGSPLIVSLGALAAIAIAVFVWLERHVAEPILPPRLFAAGVALSAIAAWLLLRIEEQPGSDPYALARRVGIAAERVDAGLAELTARQLVRPGAVARSFALTASGCDAYDRLASARRERLAQLAAQWPDEQRQQLATVLRRLAVDLVPARGHGDVAQPAAS